MYKTLKTPLTPSVLKFFINAGFEYCLYKLYYTGQDVSVILLTPVKQRPSLKQIQNYDALFLTCEEPFKMVNDTNTPPVMMELEFNCLSQFVDHLLKGGYKTIAI
jgi:hypothetical protein